MLSFLSCSSFGLLAYDACTWTEMSVQSYGRNICPCFLPSDQRADCLFLFNHQVSSLRVPCETQTPRRPILRLPLLSPQQHLFFRSTLHSRPTHAQTLSSWPSCEERWHVGRKALFCSVWDCPTAANTMAFLIRFQTCSSQHQIPTGHLRKRNTFSGCFLKIPHNFCLCKQLSFHGPPNQEKRASRH